MNTRHHLTYAVMLAVLVLALVPPGMAAAPEDQPLQARLEQAAVDLVAQQLGLSQVEHTLAIHDVAIEETSARIDVQLVVSSDEVGEIADLVRVFALHDGRSPTYVFREPSADFYTYADQVSTNLLPARRLSFWKTLWAREQETMIASTSPYKLPWTGGEQYYVYQDNDSHYDFSLSYKLVRAARGGEVYVRRASENGGCCSSSCNYLNNYVRILHADGTYGWYLHLKYGSIAVNTGDQVAQGACLAISGATGWACGAHLHFNTSSDSANNNYLSTTFAEGPVPDEAWSPPSQNSTASCTDDPEMVVVEEPDLTPAFGPICQTGWYAFTNNRGHNAYLTLNTNDPAQSTNSGRWTPNLPQAGRWRVEAFIANHGPMTWPCTGQYISWDTSDARYTVHYNGGTAAVTGNQAPFFDGWLDLGVYDFAAGSGGYVELDDLNGEPNLSRFISFSAVRFTWEGNGGGPGATVLEDPTTLHPAYNGDTCSCGWHRFTNDRGHYAYLTLNTNDPGQSTNWAQWRPNLPNEGDYRVEAYIPDHDPFVWPCTGQYISWDTSDARYKIHYATDTIEVPGNQTPLANQWLDLGTFHFVAGTDGYVELSDLNGETNLSHFVSFSAMRFTPQGGSAAVETLILNNQQQLANYYGNSEATRITDKLAQLAAHQSVQGQIVRVEDDPSVAAAYTAWNADLTSVTKANAVAETIHALIDQHLALYPDVRYLVIVGDDRVIPFYRVPDRTSHPESNYDLVDPTSTVGAALEADMTLSDNFYADKDRAAWHGFHPYLPDLALGRLIENPDEIVGQIDDFLASDGRAPTNAAVVGCDVVKDVAREIRDLWQEEDLQVDTLINDSWDREDFTQSILNVRHDMVSLNHHANHYTIQTGNGDLVTSHHISASTGDHTQSLFFSLGCHSGLNVTASPADTFDLAQVFARKGAIYVGNTGYGWGSSTSIAWSERLMSIFADMVYRRSNSVGQALAGAKRSYCWAEADFDATDEKIVLESTLYGLPMFEFDWSGGQAASEPETPPFTIAVQATSVIAAGLTRNSITYSYPAFDATSGDWGVIYSLAGEVQADDGVPVQPRVAADITFVKTNAHGAVFRGGIYTDVPGFDPVIDLAATDGTIISEPEFDAPGWYPSMPYEINRLNDSETLVQILGQFHADQGVERLYSQTSFDVYYHDSSQDWAAPTIAGIESRLQVGQAEVTVEAHDASGIQAAIVAYNDGQGTWASVELSPAGDIWTGSFPASLDTEFFVQVVDGAGNVSTADHGGQYLRPGQGWHRVSLPLIVRQY